MTSYSPPPLCPTGLETLVHANTVGAQVIYEVSELTSGFRAGKVVPNICLTSAATCTRVTLPSSTATSPATPSSFNTTASSRSAQVSGRSAQPGECFSDAALDLVSPLCSSCSRHHQQPREDLPGGAEEPSLLCSGIRRCAAPATLSGGSGVSVCFHCRRSNHFLILFFSRCQCDHSRGHLFLWNVRLRGERSLVLALEHRRPCGGKRFARLVTHSTPEPRVRQLLKEASAGLLPR